MLIYNNNPFDTNRAEQSFLSQLIDKPSLLNRCDIKTDDFQNMLHGVVFSHISDMFDSDIRVTPTSLSNRINKDWTEDCLIGIIQAKDHEDPVYTADCLVKARIRRSIDSVGKSMLSENKSNLDGLSVVNSYMDRLANISNQQESDSVVSSSVHSSRALETILNPKSVQMIPTGIKELDDKTGGLARGLVTIVGALSGMGKSCFLTNLYYNIAVAGYKILFISMEDDAEKIHLRMFSRLTRIQARKLVQGKELSMFEVDQCREASKKINFEDCYIDDSTCQDTASISRTVKRLKARHGLDVVIVDYIGEMVRGGDVYNKISDAAKELRDIAKENHVAMVPASQLSRKIMERKDPIPQKSDLRDSGKIEEVARNVWLLHRPSYFDQSGVDDKNLQIVVDKASHGLRGIVNTEIELDYMDISDWRG